MIKPGAAAAAPWPLLSLTRVFILSLSGIEPAAGLVKAVGRDYLNMPLTSATSSFTLGPMVVDRYTLLM